MKLKQKIRKLSGCLGHDISFFLEFKTKCYKLFSFSLTGLKSHVTYSFL